jgi:hypothetical protein
MNRRNWSERCRKLREVVERDNENWSLETIHPSDPKKYFLEAEYRLRQALMQRDDAESSLIFGKYGTPLLALLGLVAVIVAGAALLFAFRDWIARP